MPVFSIMGTERKTIARVSIDLSLDRYFDYRIPKSLTKKLSVGSRVRVPFGKSQRQGYVVALPSKSPYSDDADDLKLVDAIIDSSAAIPENLIRLAEWMASYYCCSREQAIRGLLPAVVRNRKTAISEIAAPNHTILPSKALLLNEEQENALTRIVRNLKSPNKTVILLHGVTGSGKTEVYLQVISVCIQDRKSAIVLVPEIALTPQTFNQFQSRFSEQVSILHSGLSDAQRSQEWHRINGGEVSIVIGARSALFAPLRNLGLIIVDEEHEPSYKQDQHPRYHARDVAVMHGMGENATVVLGTATPSLESYHNVEKGKYKLIPINKRIEEQALPTIEIVDLAAESTPDSGLQLFSRRLLDAIQSRLDLGEQVILFLNRRGYASQLHCLCCGYTATCSDCSIRFTYHRHQARLICHLCGLHRPAPDQCPDCGDTKIRYTGLGTQKIEAMIKARFPMARVQRMDSDAVSNKGEAYRQLFNSFRSGAIDILVGTQMIAKGHHFPNVTLVGIILADLSLNLPDFRAGERTFQLLVQVAGRAGRCEKPGHVIVQTFNPFHPVLQSVVKHDYHAFYKSEIEYRRQLDLPPHTHLVLVLFKGEDEDQVAQEAQRFATAIKPSLSDWARVAAPVPSPIVKKYRKYHYQIMLATHEIVHLSRILKEQLRSFKRKKGVRIVVDIDPYSLL